MKTKIITSAIGTMATILSLFLFTSSAYSQMCGGMKSPASKDNEKNASTEKSTPSKATSDYTCPMHPEITSDKAGSCPKCGMALVQQTPENAKMKMDTVMYTCSMHPEVQSSKPGNCPKCGMALVKKSDAKGMKMMCPMMGGMDDMNKTGSKEKTDTTKQSKNKTNTPAQTGISYTCPMHPDVKSDKPGNCPKCGMKLTEKK